MKPFIRRACPLTKPPYVSDEDIALTEISEVISTVMTQNIAHTPTIFFYFSKVYFTIYFNKIRNISSLEVYQISIYMNNEKMTITNVNHLKNL